MSGQGQQGLDAPLRKGATRGLRAFVIESNRIEGIDRPPTDVEVQAHEEFLARPMVLVSYLEQFVRAVTGRPLRDKLGMDVRVGDHLPPPGGLDIRRALGLLCDRVNKATFKDGLLVGQVWLHEDCKAFWEEHAEGLKAP